jgi:hypothetical protein
VTQVESGHRKQRDLTASSENRNRPRRLADLPDPVNQKHATTASNPKGAGLLGPLPQRAKPALGDFIGPNNVIVADAQHRTITFTNYTKNDCCPRMQR